MRENLKAIKRLVAFLLVVLMVGAMVGNDIFVIATEENNCGEYTDEQTYAANVLQPVGTGDGYCDHCGQVEQSHSEEAQAAGAVEEAPVEATEAQPAEAQTGENQPAEGAVVSEQGAEPTPEAPAETPATEGTVAEGTAEGTTPEGEAPAEPTEPTGPRHIINPDGTITEVEPTEDEQISPDSEIIDEELDEELEETEEIEEPEECEHEWTYTSNEDGTHSVKCSKCGEQQSEECTLDEEGICTKCGYHKEEEVEECEHDWQYTDNNNGTHTKKCAKCDEEVIEACTYGEDGLCIYCGSVDMTLEEQSFSETFGEITVTVSGLMPRHAKVTVYKAGTKIIENIVNDKLENETFTAYEAYNINIYDAGGNKYQPNEDGNSVKVSFSGIDQIDRAKEEEITVYRIEDDYQITEKETEVKDEEVIFEAEHFSTYTVGTTTNGNFIVLYPSLIDGFGYVNTNNTDATLPYLKVLKVNFRMYADVDGTYTFSATAYKDLTSATEPDSGTAVATGSVNINVEESTRGWHDVEIILNDVTGQDRYVTYGSNYSVVVVPSNESPSGDIKLGYGDGAIVSRLKTGAWSTIDQTGIFVEKNSKDSPSDYNIELSANAGDTYEITEIVGPDPSSANSSSTKINPYAEGAYLYSKGDTGTFTAKLSNDAATRKITWSSTNPAVLDVDSATGAFTAKAAGEVTVTASYVNSGATPSTKSITVKVIQFTIGGVDPNGASAPYSITYAGKEIKPEVKGFSDSANTASITVSAAYSNNTDVTDSANVVISYSPATGKTFAFNRKFTIAKLTLYPEAFTDGTNLTVANGVITSITNIDPTNAKYDNNSRPEYGKDFTANIVSITTSSNGKTYVVDLTGEGNYTGTVRWTKTSTADVGITVELTDDSALNACYYSGNAITLKEGWPEVVFKDSEGNKVDFINATTADYTIYDKGGSIESNINAGQKTLTFKIKDSYSDGNTTVTPGLAGTTFSVDFWILPADLSKAKVTWTNGNEFAHDGKEHKPVAGTDFTVSFKDNPVDTSEYTVSWTGDYTNITGITNIPAIVLQGAGKNFATTSQISSQYKIVANYDNDLIIRIQVGNNSYDGTKANNYAIPYSKTFNGSAVAPNIIVYMNGTTYTEGTDYHLNVVNEGKSELTEDVGTKQITITPLDGGAFSGKSPVTATYKIVAKEITTGMVDISKLSEKTYTGSEIYLDAAEPTEADASVVVSSAYDIKVSYNGKILKRGTDYTINYENNKNAGTATFSLVGDGNYKGTLQSTNYKFKINPAELSLTDATKALATLATTSYVYDGKAHEPAVTVKLNSNEITQVESGKANYTVTYASNITVGDATATVTGSNNLTGEVVLPFRITTVTAAYDKITIMTDYTATPLSGDAAQNTDSDGTVTRFYTCNVPVTYTGRVFTGSVGVFAGGTKLTNGTDYRYAYIKAVDAANYNTATEAGRLASPRLVIYGQGSYQNNNAEVYFNIQPIDISTDTTFTATDDNNFQYDWTGNEVELSNLVVKVGGRTLTAGTETTGDYYVTYTGDKKSAGTQTVTITGRGNYTGTREITYQIGRDISSAYISILGAYRDSDIFVDKVSLNDLKTQNGEETSALTSTVRWRGNDAAPRYTIYATDQTSVLTAGTHYNITAVPEFGESNYSARKVGEETGTNYNTVHVTITSDITKGYYGKVEFYYDIYPQDIGEVYEAGTSVVGIRSEGTEDRPYTGGVQTITPALLFINGSGINYSLNANDVKDYEPTTYNIGPDATAEPIYTVINGIGNFTGKVNLKNTISKSYLQVWAAKDSEATPKLVGTTSAAASNYDLSDGTKEYYIAYKHNGKEQCPVITLRGTDGTTVLTEGLDYSIVTPSDKISAENKTITVVVPETSPNLIAQTITINYVINTNSIETGYAGKIDDINYVHETMDAATIKAKVEATENPLNLTVSVGEEKLVYGTDYEIVTADADGSVLTAIKKQATTAAETKIQGENNAPGAGTSSDNVNWIYVHGINAYSGYMKVYFNHVLDISSVYADVTIRDAHYNLDQGVPTTPITPIIKYQTVTDAAGEYTGVLANSLNHVTITRAREGLPGPDANITVTGKENSACTGIKTKAEYANTDGTQSEVYFLADLSQYTAADISFADGTVYRYTGQRVTVRPIGAVLNDATFAETSADSGDYTVIYTQDPNNHTTNMDAVEVGTWYAVIKATDDGANPSKFFIPNSNTGAVFSFKIKYDISTATIEFVNPDDRDDKIESISYTGSPYSFIDNTIVTIADKKVYDIKSDLATNGYFTISPVSATTKGTYTVTISSSSDEFAFGNKSKEFKITAVSIATKATWKLYDPDNTSLEKYSFTYIGSGITPVVKGVLEDGTELREGTDFKVSYHNNTNVGDKTAYVSITGKGSYECPEFRPTNGKYSITKLNLSDSHVVIEADEATYSGYYKDPDNISTENNVVKLTPSYAVYYVDDTKGIKNKLQQQTDDNTTGDWKLSSIENNTVAASKDADTGAPKINITADGAASGNTTGQTSGTFTINQLNLNSGDIKIAQNTTEFTGSEIDVSNIVKLTTSYKDENGNTVTVPLTQKGYKDISDTICDYEVTVTKGNTNYTSGKVKDMGTYTITITGINSCTSSIETYFTITGRSLESNYHYYYDNGANPGWVGTWTYDPTNKRYVCVGKSNGVDEKLAIYVYDVETVDAAGVTPTVVIDDTGRADVASKRLVEGTDYTVTASNNKTAASAAWSKNTTIDANGGYHATVAADSPYIVITGMGDYEGSITLPFNIGKNINTLGLTITYGANGTSYTYDKAYDNPSTFTNPRWSYTYNGVTQVPSVTVYNGSKRLAKNTDYTVTYTDPSGDSDTSINAGYKNVVVTGIGDYCGTMSQFYAITRKPVTAPAASFTNETTMSTSGGEFTFAIKGNSVIRLTSASAKTYLVDTGLLTEAEANQYIGYYYAIYNGHPVRPGVSVVDNKLGAAGTTKLQIDEDNDLDISYNRDEQVVKFEKSTTGINMTCSEVVVGFKGKADNTVGNYYVPNENVSAQYTIKYLILQHNIANDFVVSFKNGVDGNKYDYTGRNLEPAIKVTNGTYELVEGDDYEATYTDNLNPGKATVTVKGINNYRGEKSLNFYIWGDLSRDYVSVCFKDENGNYVEGVQPQQYTGTYITYGSPEIYLLLNTKDEPLTKETDYIANVKQPSSDDGYITNGTVTYTGNANSYWTGDKVVNYSIEFNAEDVTVTNFKNSYEYTGYDIEPDFKLNVSTGEITNITYYRDDNLLAETTDLKSVGKITPVITYKIGNYTGTISDSKVYYNIVPRDITGDEDVVVVSTKDYPRYTGRAVEPANTVYINSTNLKTGANQQYELTQDTDYTVNYKDDNGNPFVYGDAYFTITGITTEVTGSKRQNYTIKLQPVANLRVIENTGDSLTCEWVRDLYSQGTDLEIRTLDSDGNYKTYAMTRVVGRKNTYTFDGLKSSTTYQIAAKAYAVTSDGTTIQSDEATVEETTDIATADIDVTNTSTGKATITWNNNGDVVLYYIYRATDETSEGRVVAIIPASTGSFTNSASAGTYYYYIVGYGMVDGKLAPVNESKHMKVVVN